MKRLAFLVMLLLSGYPAGAASDDLVGALGMPGLWQAYKRSFISPGGRVIDNANGDISHSEGQGYGMLLAVAAEDPETFDTLWTWTRAQLMLRDDGLAAWRWDPATTPHVADRNNASDGDILIAWALAEAGQAWSQPAYKAAALLMTRAIVAHDVMKDGPFAPTLRPGSTGFGAADQPDGPVVNPSYWVFPAFKRLAVLVPDEIWPALTASGLRLLAKAQFGPGRLPSDWVSLATSAPLPAEKFTPTFGYDAIRIPLYLTWAGVGGPDTLAPFAALFADPAAAPRRINVMTGERLEPLDDSGYRAVAALTRCGLRGTPFPADLRTAAVDRYYPTTLRALALVAIHQSVQQCQT